MVRRHALGQPAFFVASSRLETGIGLGKENQGILEKVGEQSARAGLPVVVGGGVLNFVL